MRASTNLFGLFVLLVAAPASAADDVAPPPPRPPNRDEFIPFPVLGGNSDIGFEFGVAGTYARFREGYFPYRYKIQPLLAASIKTAGGLRFVQHRERVRVDIPHFLSKRLRLDTQVGFLRRVDTPWFGVGNATGAPPRPAPPDTASAYFYVAQTASGRALLRIKTDSPLDIALFARGRYVVPDPSPGSRLADDLASGAVIGGKAAYLQTVAAGLMLDTRDDELVPRRGIFYAAAIAGTVGSAERVRFGEASIVLSHYASFGRTLIFANRVLASMKFGDVPFYELQQGDVFAPEYLLGGSKGVRGVRLGRYAGLVKALANTELRILPLPRFRVLGSSILAGTTAFFDAGRVWSEYGPQPSTDGTTLGLRWGAGGGVFFEWNQAHVFRIDGAYSPDQSGGPFAFYFDSAFIF